MRYRDAAKLHNGAEVTMKVKDVTGFVKRHFTVVNIVRWDRVILFDVVSDDLFFQAVPHHYIK